MRINNNLLAMNTHRQMGIVQGSQSKSMEKLSSGYRINRAGDDAAGLAISEKMRGQIRGLSQASRNSQDAISLIQTAEGALNETHSILQRMRELAVQSSSDTNTSKDREKIQSEIDNLTSEINRIGGTTEFNTMTLLNGDRSIETATVTGDTKLDDVTLSADYAAGVTDNNMTTTDVFKNGVSITGAGQVGQFVQSTATNSTTGGATLKIERTADGEFTVSTNIVLTTGATFTSADTMAYTAGEDFTYDAHGVSFTIEAADLAQFDADTDSITIDIAQQHATIAGDVALTTQNDWSNNGAATGGQTVISSGISLDVTNNDILDSATSVEVSFADNSYTVHVENSAGDTLVNDTVTLTAGATFTAGTVHDANGVSFTFTNSLSVGATSSATYTVTDGDMTTSTATTETVAADNSLSFQIGANESQSMSLTLDDMRSEALGLSSTVAGVDGEAGYKATATVNNGTDSTAVEYSLDVSTFEAAGAAITKIDDALESVSKQRSQLGAVQNRLEHTIANLDTSAENLQASESRIRDVDMAKEMMEFTKNNILQQAAQSMLAQANQAPQGVLQLLR